MNITDIDFSTFVVERDFPQRKLYYKDGSYIKIWNNDYVYKKYFENAYRNDFYSDISLLKEVVYEGDNIVGYTTKAGKPVSYDNYDKEKLADLVEKLSAKCLTKNMFYIDFVIENIAEFDNRYYIVDLEAVIPYYEIADFPDIKEVMYFNNLEYRKKISLNFDDTRIVRQHTKWGKDIKYGTANGRIFLEKEYLPTLSGKVLFIGVNYYTDFYHRLINPWDDGDMETLDVTNVEHGSPRKHYICNILDFNPGYTYDHVCMFGIMGHNDDWDIIRTDDEVRALIRKLDSLVKHGGTLLIGPATQRPETNNEYWANIFSMLTNYDVIENKKIDINCIWRGKKR